MSKIIVAGRVYWAVQGVVYTTLAAARDALHGAR